jgi:hypothetical protein
MGKKSRKKRERRERGLNPLHALGRRDFTHDIDMVLRQARDALQAIYAQYNPYDVVLSLEVSDLWLPNISAHVTHHLALGVALSMHPKHFTRAKGIDTYDEFCEFVAQVYRVIPSFPSLEDFVPEPDWGDIRVSSDGEYRAVFYGCAVERISDFVEAFRLIHAEQPDALADMACAIALQNHVISSISRDVVGNVDNISGGHREVPSALFWGACRAVLSTACIAIQSSGHKFSPQLTIELGLGPSLTTWAQFGDAVMDGTSLAATTALTDGKHLPVSLRNATSVAIDAWATRLAASSVGFAGLCRRIGTFLLRRFGDPTVCPGPLRLVSRNSGIERHIAAVCRAGRKIYLVLVVSIDEIPALDGFEQQVHRLVSSGDWAFLLEDSNQYMQLRNEDGSPPGSADIGVLAILDRVATSWLSIKTPKGGTRLLSLPDFVSIFDSLSDTDELERFWSFVEQHDTLLGPVGGIADQFASFRESHALLISGAVKPDMIGLDPHWGSNWRFRDLMEFWTIAPDVFPDGNPTWNVTSGSDGIQRLIAKGAQTLAWSVKVRGCTVQAVLEVAAQTLDVHNGRLLELFVHCLIDSLAQRGSLLEETQLFEPKQIVLYCRANMLALASEEPAAASEQISKLSLLDSWVHRPDPIPGCVDVTVEVNLARLQERLDSPVDASFEVECLTEVVQGLSDLLRKPINPDVVHALASTTSRLPRFTLKRVERRVDVPDYASPELPEPEHYKIARRDLAVALSEQGVAAPARYELAPAKTIIDAARETMRQNLHRRISSLDRDSLLLFCIEQNDALIAEHHRSVFQVKQSLTHEVEYDRAQALIEAHDRFNRNARNYRYLLECCLSLPAHGTGKVDAPTVVQLLATINWLFVLYGASDTLHNGIEAGGIELDDSYVPEVFYSDDREEKEQRFSHEAARDNLGLDLKQEDEVNSILETDKTRQDLDDAFLAQLGFSLTQLLQALTVLTRWRAVGGSSELKFCYQASAAEIVSKLVATLEGLSEVQARQIIEFLTLKPTGIRRLLGKETDESDVPVWEHTKRGDRYTIRPLVALGNELIAWGAATAERTSSVWSNAVSNGYLPADFEWPAAKKQVRAIKESIEKRLEVQAFNVCSRMATYVLQGVDFKRRFPKEKFDDVGDFDVLAYWPESNLWLSVECKYNQSPFCLKDARRLRDRIFGTGENRGQFAKIEGRRAFLAARVDQLRQLVGWPEPTCTAPPRFIEVYVSRDIYWWMRNPPYEVPTHFVRIDALHGWLQSHLST